MKILMVSPFPPLRDGVGKYAAQEVRALRDQGHEVEVLAPVACAAHHVENFKTWWGGMAKLRAYARRYDKVILQYQPSHFHWRGEGPARIVSNFWMMVAFRTVANLTIVCHEVEYPPPNWPNWHPQKLFERLAWRGAKHVEFHTSHEVEEMSRKLGVAPRNFELRDHGRYFKPAVSEDRAEARRRLKLPDDVPVLLCIGFIQPHKGFDRALRAFRRVSGDARLAVVGSVRSDSPAHRGYMDELRYLAAADPRVGVHERMVSDDEFDRWIIASDVVVLPYREIWSSGVLERARVLGRPVIASAVGGLREQLRPGDAAVSTDEELAEAIADVVGAGRPEPPEPMTVQEAIAFVTEEANRRGVSAKDSRVDRALYTLSASRGVHVPMLPSTRPYVGRWLDLAKRVMRRGLGWLLTPLLGQINYFQDLTVEALEEIVAQQHRQLQAHRAYSQIREDQRSVLARARGCVSELSGDGPVLHIGCDRGEIVELLREEGIDARGVDIEVGEGATCLLSLEPASLAGVLLTLGDHDNGIEAVVLAAGRAIRPGGVLLVDVADEEMAALDLPALVPTAERAGFVDVIVRTLMAQPPRTPIDVGPDAPEWAQRLAKTLDQELDTAAERESPLPHELLVARVPETS
jgi:glycosyltransferase involved in cell wall biosynthesis